jgi:predicted dehydrogenase
MSIGVRSLGVAVVGLGVGEQHALAYQRTGCSVRRLFDLDPDRAAAVSSRLGEGLCSSSLESILGDPSIEIVSIASFDDAHFEQVAASLAAGKHVFVEKPLCRSIHELETIAAAWRRSGRKLRSNLVLRAAPLYRWVKAQVEGGAFGEIYAFDGDYLYGRLHKLTEGWRNQVEDYSVLQGGGVHLLDLMLWLTGQRPERVSAVGNRISSAGTAFRYHDFAAATFTFPSGLVGRVTANFGSVHRHQHVMRIFGTRATFIVDDAGPRLHLSRDPNEPATPLAHNPLPATKGDLIPEFVASVTTGAAMRPDTQHEFDVISACVAADRALASGGAVTVDYV